MSHERDGTLDSAVLDTLAEEVAALDTLAEEVAVLDTLAEEVAVLDTLAEEVTVLAPDGRFVRTNGSWRRFADGKGLQAGSLEGTDYLAAMAGHDEYATAAWEGLTDVLSGDRASFELEYPCHSPDERRWFLLRARPLDHDGRRFVVVTHTDVTERRLAEAEAARTAAHAGPSSRWNCDGPTSTGDPPEECLSRWPPYRWT